MWESNKTHSHIVCPYATNIGLKVHKHVCNIFEIFRKPLMSVYTRKEERSGRVSFEISKDFS